MSFDETHAMHPSINANLHQFLWHTMLISSKYLFIFFSYVDLLEKAQVADFETAVHYAGKYLQTTIINI